MYNTIVKIATRLAFAICCVCFVIGFFVSIGASIRRSNERKHDIDKVHIELINTNSEKTNHIYQIHFEAKITNESKLPIEMVYAEISIYNKDGVLLDNLESQISYMNIEKGESTVETFFGNLSATSKTAQIGIENCRVEIKISGCRWTDDYYYSIDN